MGESSSRFQTKAADSRTRFARQSDVRAVRRRPETRKRSHGSLPAGINTDGSDPHGEGGDCLTRCDTECLDTPPHRLTAPAVKKGGSLPYNPSPLARLGLSGLAPKARTKPAKNGRVGPDTPPHCFPDTPPHVRVRFLLPCALPCALPRNGPDDGPLPFDPTPSPPRAD